MPHETIIRKGDVEKGTALLEQLNEGLKAAGEAAAKTAGEITEAVKPWSDADPQTQARWWSWSVLVNKGLKHSYAGTLPAAVKAKRRAANKVAKASRKVNR